MKNENKVNEPVIKKITYLVLSPYCVSDTTKAEP